MNFVSSLFNATTGNNPQFPYELGDTIETHGSVFTLKEGKRKSDGLQVSIFTYDTKTNDPEAFSLAQACCRRLKTMRHPNIIKLLDSYETETSLQMATEKVRPLFLDLRANEEMSVIQKEFQVKWGLHQILKSLGFLNGDCSLVHGNIGLHSVYVDEGGEWKLGGLEFTSGPKDIALHSIPFKRYLPREVQKAGFNPNAPTWSLDIYSLGILLWEVHNMHRLDSVRFTDSDYRQDVSSLPKVFSRIYLQLIHENVSHRPSPEKVLTIGGQKGGLFDDEFFEVCLFLEEFQLKDQQEKNNFFRKLKPVLEKIPPMMRLKKILPQLINAILYGGANVSMLLGYVLQIGQDLPSADYEALIIPCVSKLFSSTDRQTRMTLLQKLDSFADHLPEDLINNEIYPNIAKGFQDNLPAMREESMKASLRLSSKLSEKTINDILLKSFSQLQVDPQPGIRVNTTICLGKIAPRLTENQRKRVLLPAFARPLKDPFHHSRIASLKAIVATAEYYDCDVVANKVLPMLAPLAVDPEEDVRTQVFRAITLFVQILEKNSKTMPPSPSTLEKKTTPAASPASAAMKATGSGSSLNATPVSSTGSTDSTWTGWAVNSAMSTFSKGDNTSTATTSTPPPQQQQQQQQKQSSTQPILPENQALQQQQQQQRQKQREQQQQQISEGKRKPASVLQPQKAPPPTTPTGSNNDGKKKSGSNFGFKLSSGQKEDPFDSLMDDGWGANSGGWDNGSNWGTPAARKESMGSLGAKSSKNNSLAAKSNTANTTKAKTSGGGWGDDDWGNDDSGWGSSSTTTKSSGGGWGDAGDDDWGEVVRPASPGPVRKSNLMSAEQRKAERLKRQQQNKK